MSIDAATKTKLISEYATTEGDTGSPEVQIAILSHRIAALTEHLKEHKRMTTTAVVDCCCSSAVVVDCSTTSQRPTSPDTGPLSNGSASAASRHNQAGAPSRDCGPRSSVVAPGTDCSSPRIPSASIEDRSATLHVGPSARPL